MENLTLKGDSMKTYMKFCWLMVFMIGAVALAWAPYNDPYGYLKSTLDIEYQNAQENAATARYEALVEDIAAAHKARQLEDREWMIIPREYRNFIRNLNLDLSPSLIYALVHYESWWYPTAVGYNPNGTRDLGLMQLNSRYMHYFAAAHYTQDGSFDPFNPYHNLEVGLKHFASLLAYYEGDIIYALSAYNAGRYAVDRGYIPTSTRNYRSRIISKSAYLASI